MSDIGSGRMLGAARSWRRRPEMRISGDPGDVQAVTVRYLLYVMLPAWLVPGIADYIMHRRTRIERTSGARESLIHLLMMTEIAVLVTLALLCEANPALLAVIVAASAIHEATAIWDVRTAVDGGREVRPAEQHTHSFLESLPFTAASAMLCLHWDQAARALRDPRDRSLWRLRLRPQRLPARYLLITRAAQLLFIAGPYGEELLRCIRARHPSRRTGDAGRLAAPGHQAGGSRPRAARNGQ
jgi:hypothetical protein